MDILFTLNKPIKPLKVKSKFINLKRPKRTGPKPCAVTIAPSVADNDSPRHDSTISFVRLYNEFYRERIRTAKTKLSFASPAIDDAGQESTETASTESIITQYKGSNGDAKVYGQEYPMYIYQNPSARAEVVYEVYYGISDGNNSGRRQCLAQMLS